MIYTGGSYRTGPTAFRCRASVSDGFHFCQCSRKPKVWRTVDGHAKPLGFCGQHDPEVVKARKQARRVRWDAEEAARKAAWDRRSARQAAQEAAIEALRAIVAGHNDPGALARQVLALYPEEPSVNQDLE